MQKVIFKTPVHGVRAEKRERVTFPAGTYDLISARETRPNSFKVSFADPKATHPGGKDGKTELPCTILAQVAGDQMTVRDVSATKGAK
jgi:hypothetical protein